MATPVRLNITIEDDKGKKALHQVHFTYDEPTTKIDVLFSLAQAYVEVLDNCIKGRITGVSWSFPIPLPLTIKTSAGWDSDVEEKLKISLRSNDRLYSHTTIPTYSFMDSGVPVDDNSPEFDNYAILLQLIVNPFSVDDTYYLWGSNSRGSSSIEVVDEREIFVK